jgi:hypothetical protein
MATGFANINVTGPGERGTLSPGGFDPRSGLLDVDAVSAGRFEEAAPPPPPPPEPATSPLPPPSDEQFDQQIRQMLADLVSGKGMNVDTAEEEALIKQFMQDQIGQGLVEQRARMGRAGFGASGALAAMEGDVQRQAAQRATQETLATRRQAEQDAIERALNAVDIDVTKRKEGREAAFDEEFLNALKSAMGQEVTPEPNGPLEWLTRWGKDVEKDVEDTGLRGRGEKPKDLLEALKGLWEAQKGNVPFIGQWL